ncbi:SigE family RNA polymerase sigma factor [Nocardioides marinquilinus]|uniref:SigE family RNA polymerase sigma factor n=1 Tax=Nocardioides marinquilinus TaxID=1210400 RepID=A0ABP9PXM1_9ACTN
MSSGGDDGFEEYAAARWCHLVHAGVLLGCTPHEAEDLAQATLLRCYTAWTRVQRAENRDAYVTRVLVNGLRASRRRRWWGERPMSRLPDQPADDDHATALDGTDAVERALGRLPRGQREVVVLRFWSHLSVAETADALGVAPGTVKSRLSRALAALADDTDIHDIAPGRHP